MLKVKRKRRCPYPPVGRYIRPPEVKSKFKDIEIKDNFIPGRLRPLGARQSTAEANILSKIKAIANGLASTNGDIIGR